MAPNSINRDRLVENSFQTTPIAALFIDTTSKIILRANKAAVKLYGGDLEGKNVSHINFHPDLVYKDLRERILNKKISVIQTKHITFNKKIIDVECHIKVISQQGKKIFYSLIRDITDELIQKEKLINEASIDDLTGIPNRRFFTNVIENYLENLKRYDEKFSLIYFDIDNFKYYNDQYGHAFGDDIIKSTVKIINKEKRASDFLARLGGDEFVLILNRVLNQNDLAKICKNLGEIILKNSKALNPPVTVSIGASIIRKFEAAESAISRIDRAMYAAKKRGGNTFHISTLESDKNVSDLLYLLEGINLQHQKKFSVSYQPIVDLKNNAIHKVEIFLRPNDKLLKNFSVQEVIRDAIKHHVISNITLFVLNKACEDYADKLKHVRPDLKIGINITLHELINDFPIMQNNLTSVLKKHRISPKNFVLEINEFSPGSIEPQDLTVAYKNISHLKKLGFLIAIDDFGSGYSNLPYFQEIEIDYLKIDKSYLTKILTGGKKSRLIYESIVDLCKKFSISIISEGIETKEQLDFVKQIGVQFGQGYLHSKPLTLVKILSKLKN
jgi:diguanylate cyclase (GGDEF)-like protein/PAS domain S-box-containing protein